MGRFNREEVKGYWIDGELVCPDCVGPEELDALQTGGSFAPDREDVWDYYFCTRCEEWFS